MTPDRTESMKRRVTSQVLFVECSDERAVVDATVVEAVLPDLPVGTPVTFVLRLPASRALASVVEATLQAWIDRGALVAIEVDARHDIDRATMTDGTASIRLEVEAAA